MSINPGRVEHPHMSILLNPNVAYLVLVAGFVLAILALLSPGTGILELGALFMLVGAGYAIANLPVNGWAIALLVVGVFPFLIALRRTHRWPFLIISLVALVVGSVFMFTTPQGQPAVNVYLAIVVSTLVVAFLWFAGRKGIEALEQPARNPDEVVGKTGEARTSVYKEGSVYVGGEDWSARSRVIIPAGTKVRVISRDGLVLTVEPIYPPAEPGEA